jgi:hypothetical protein
MTRFRRKLMDIDVAKCPLGSPPGRSWDRRHGVENVEEYFTRDPLIVRAGYGVSNNEQMCANPRRGR